jgi:DNA-binding GntR family transcriptional regulator
MLLICLNKTSETRQAVIEAGAFAVNVLSEGQVHLAAQFARKGADKFAGVDVSEGQVGVPVLGGSLATMECRTVETVTGGTHTVFLAEVVAAGAEELEPLTYFRGKFGRLERVREAAAYQSLRDWILSRQAPAGEALDLKRVGSLLDLESEHLSTALLKLASEHLVTRTPEGAFAPTPITVEMADGLFDARCAIEIGVADAQVGRLTPDTIAPLKDLATTLVNIVGEPEPDFARFLEASHAYHGYFVSLGGCPQLTEAYARLGISGVWRSAIADKDWWNLFDVKHHAELTESLVNGDLDEVKRNIYEHNAQVKTLVRQIISDVGGEI